MGIFTKEQEGFRTCFKRDNKTASLRSTLFHFEALHEPLSIIGKRGKFRFCELKCVKFCSRCLSMVMALQVTVNCVWGDCSTKYHKTALCYGMICFIRQRGTRIFFSHFRANEPLQYFVTFNSMFSLVLILMQRPSSIFYFHLFNAIIASETRAKGSYGTCDEVGRAKSSYCMSSSKILRINRWI